MAKEKNKPDSKKNRAKKTLDELAKGANKVIGEHIQGGWIEMIPSREDTLK